jgi:hypothetical protein
MDTDNSVLFLGDVVPFKPFKFSNNLKAVINLECPIINSGDPVKGKIILRVKENFLKNIFRDNLICASLGNNHILDYGENGLYSTLAELKNSEINYFGINEGFNDDLKPLVFEFNKIKIAFFSVVCQSTSPLVEIENITRLSILNVDEIISRVIKIRKLVQRVVVYIHWGVEESSLPKKEDILIARKMIDNDVDIVIGSHAHAPQAIEKYKNGIIAYNLGNFIMPALKNLPAYYDEKGIPLFAYSKGLMLWNRISWGLIVDMENMDYKIKKYIFIFGRIIELPFTPIDKYIELNKNASSDSYELIVAEHVNKRETLRKIRNFIYKPRIPEKLKKILWK